MRPSWACWVIIPKEPWLLTPLGHCAVLGGGIGIMSRTLFLSTQTGSREGRPLPHTLRLCVVRLDAAPS